jgi:PAS domain S-box-containing protein
MSTVDAWGTLDIARSSESYLRTIIDAIPTLVWSARPDGYVEFVNRPWLDYTGLSVSQALAWGWAVAIHPNDRDRVVDYWRSLLASGEPGEVEARLCRADGDYRWFLFRGSPIRDESGTIVRWCGTNTDIHDRRRVEEEVRARELDARLILDGIPGFVCALAATGEIEVANRRVLEYFGKSLEELQCWRSSIDVAHRDDLARDVATWRHAMQTGEPYELEHRLRRADGVYRWFALSVRPLRDAEGSIVRWLSLSTDIDDRKAAEEDVRHAQARLARAGQVATIGEMAASIAHEVNQPLTAIVANGHACLRWLSAQPPSLTAAREAAERIVRDGKDAGDVVRRVRALFKRAGVEKATLDVNDVIKEVLWLLQGEAARRRITVQAELEPALPLVWADRVQLQQLILNLLINGLEATECGADQSGKLLVRSGRHDDHEAVIEIRDYGIGLEDPEKIFDAFFTTKPNGMGMGLAICRSIVDAHGGRLWAARPDGRGTTFCFTLPLQDARCAS